MKSPLLFICFNRPEKTKIVWERIKEIKPKKLYLSCDGPRTDEEQIKVNLVKSIIEEITWECEVYRKYQPFNKGCKLAVSEAIDWAFNNENRLIILEDDCLPHKIFFEFCEKNLDLYQEDENIGIISGQNPSGIWEDNNSIRNLSTKYPLIWGWATWKRTWNNYNVELNNWHQDKHKLSRIFGNQSLTYWRKIFQKVYEKKIDTWDYQLFFQHFTNDLKCITSSKNLIKNIGFDEEATHTTKPNFKITNEIPDDNLDLKLEINEKYYRFQNNELDKWLEKNIFRKQSLLQKIKKKLDYLIYG